MSDMRDIRSKFEDWIDEQVDYNGSLPAGFDYVDHDDPWTFLVTDGTDEYVVEVNVDVIKQPRSTEGAA